MFVLIGYISAIDTGKPVEREQKSPNVLSLSVSKP